ncbi:MAG: hypothetical protein M3314_05355 [Actinomycetota bacterium]|nr:hypothetical protein [Actinomycetota bacterium]
MGEVVVESDRIRVGARFSLTLQRTLRVPDDGNEYPLPPGLGRLPVLRVADFDSRLPTDWNETGAVFVPLYQREALWLQFDGAWWKPNAVQVAVGHVNAVSGEGWDEELRADPQNYVVCPDQPWLDGINAGPGMVRQFVAVPLGQGLTVEAQVTGQEMYGGIQVRVLEPRPGRFPDEPPPRPPQEIRTAMPLAMGAPMGIGAGGRIRQRIYPDPYGIDAWDPETATPVVVHILNSEQFEQVTGAPAPPTPVDAATYTEYGLPWFELYDEGRGDVDAPETLSKIKGVREVVGEEADQSISVDPNQVKRLGKHKT